MNLADSNITEQWLRIPPNGKTCPVTGLGHARFYRLISAAGGKIRTVSLKEPGQDRAVRLVDQRSLLAYLDRLAEEQAVKGGRV